VQLVKSLDTGKVLDDDNVQDESQPLACELAAAPQDAGYPYLRVLIEHGIDVRQTYIDEGCVFNALWLAVDSGNMHCFKALMPVSGDDMFLTGLGQKNRRGTVFHLAASRGDADILEILLQTGHPDSEVKFAFNDEIAGSLDSVTGFGYCSVMDLAMHSICDEDKRMACINLLRAAGFPDAASEFPADELTHKEGCGGSCGVCPVS